MTHQRIITPDMGEKVIQTLSKYARLPSAGLIAGQAVASAIDEVLGTGRPVYNDIDIFLHNVEWESHWPKDIEEINARAKAERPWHSNEENETKTLLASRVAYKDEPCYESDSYSCKLSVAQRDLYSIGQSRNQGVLNFVRVEWSDSSVKTLEATPDKDVAPQMLNWLTKVFDMNCTQVGVDLRSGQLHMSPLFERFMQSRQLQVVTGFTPVHSLLRYLKKRDELDVYSNDELHLKLLHRLVQYAQGDAAEATVRRRAVREGRAMIPGSEIDEECIRLGVENDGYLLWQRAGSGRQCQPLAFGRKYFEQYVKHQKLLNPYFTLTRHGRKDVWLLTSKTADANYDGYANYRAPTVVALNFSEETLAQSKTAKARESGFELLKASLTHPHQVSSFNRVRGNMGRSYCEGMEDENLRQRWLSVTPHHPEFFWAVVALPFKQQMDLMRKMRTAFKKLGIDSPWGAMVNRSSDFAARLLTDEALWEAFVAEHAGTFEPLCKPLSLPSTLNGVTIRELTTSRDLQIEGSRMHHCVGGYSSAVSNNESRIISLSAGDSSAECSTLEIRVAPSYRNLQPSQRGFPGEVQFELRQNYAPFNKKPLPILAEVAQLLKKQLNDWAKDNLVDAIELLNIPEQVMAPAFPKARNFYNFVDDDNEIPF